MSRVRAALRALPVSAAAGVAVLGGMALLAPLVDGGGWWSAAAAAVLVVCATGSAVRFAPGGTLLAPPVQLLALAAVLTALFAPAGSPAELAGVFEQGTSAIGAHPPPVPPGTGMELILAGAAGLAALASDVLSVAARTPALAGVPLFAMALVPLAVDDRGLSPAAFAAAGAGYLVLLAVDSGVRAAERTGAAGGGAGPAIRHTALSGGVVAGALAVALLVPALVPGLETGPMNQITDPAGRGRDVTATHPLVSLRRDLGSTGNQAVLSYATDAERPQYLRTSVLDTFDGTDWTMDPVTASDSARLGADGALPEPPGLSVQRAQTATTEVEVEQPLGDTPFLPLPYPAAAVEVPGDWYADPDSLVVFSTNAQDAADSYTVLGFEAEPDPAALASSGTSGSQRRALELPDGLDPRIAETTRSVTEDADDPLSTAIALQDWFTDRGRFTYDLAPPQLPDGADPLAHFLFEDRIGYCEQFAAAMTVMARQAGIPARVAVGYTPGTEASGGQWVVREGDAHAWPELYFSGHGWLRFEPTPPGGQGTASTPSYGREAPDGGGDGEGAGPAPAPSPDAGDDAGDGAADRPEEQPDEPDTPGAEPDPSAGGEDGSAGVPWAAVAAAGALALAALLFPWALRAAVRRSRVLRADRSAPPVPAAAGGNRGAPGPGGAAPDAAGAADTARTAPGAAWREVADQALDLGLGTDPAQSPRAAALSLEPRMAGAGAAAPDAEAALHRLALAEEAARYAAAPPPHPPLAGDLRSVLAALSASAGRRARARAALLPRSLPGTVARAFRSRSRRYAPSAE